MTEARQLFGKGGEDLACRELERRGYAILARRYRSRLGEIDIIARQDEVTVFIEVKTRGGAQFGGGAAAITPAKQRTITMVALEYVSRHRLFDRPCRFDAVVIDVSSGVPVVEVITNAFDSSV